MNVYGTSTPGVALRRARAEDAPAIGAVFDAAVREGWSFLGDLVVEPMFTPQDWVQLVDASSARPARPRVRAAPYAATQRYLD
jgi:hypothetical protein